MQIHAIVPMKHLNQAKSRLATLLSPLERRELALAMLHNVLTALLQASVVNYQNTVAPVLSRLGRLLTTVWVVSSDTTVLELARQSGVEPLYDTTSDMNAALNLARDTVIHAGADALLIIPADIPLITAGDVAALVQQLGKGAAANGHGSMVIVPDHEQRGTNGLGLTLPTAIPFQFGTNSFSRYLETAQTLGLTIQIYDAPTLALDIDTPDDLRHYQKMLTQQEKC